MTEATKRRIRPIEAWRAKQFPEKNEDAALIAQGRQLFQAKSCVNCHTVRGHGAMGVTAPERVTQTGSTERVETLEPAPGT